jgi:anti-sigma regulatory factor (Ser/Thr protein kinase)
VREIRVLALDFARTRCGADEPLLSEIALCVSEAVGNAVVHAYAEPGGEISVVIEAVHGGLVVEVCDEGAGTSLPSATPGLGLGMKIVSKLSDATFQPTSDATGLRVTMRFPCGVE